jgi:hypothetical protein
MLSGHWIEPMQIETRDFSDLLSSSIAYINNSKDCILPPLPKDEILRRAHRALGSGGYDLMLNNCEHFAHWCRLVDVYIRNLYDIFCFKIWCCHE